ncbi:MAG: chemotaxis protein CheV [Gammaproteobacteria bacterium]|nr:chemotaxis protein CheV [Gammaproteobacteria bacterium]
MSGILDSVNQRTQMVGQNRLELLLFRLGDRQRYGINVFKVREVLQCPRLTEMPKRHPVVRGVAHIRGATLPIIDLRMAVGKSPIVDLSTAFVIIAEYNRSIQGFLVSSVERIINLNWGEIHPPPQGSGKNNYLTAVTKVDDELVEIVDVEKILAEIVPPASSVSPEVIEDKLAEAATKATVLIADDSSVARNQVRKTLEQVGVQVVAAKDGSEALSLLNDLAEDVNDINDKILMVISDIEMPEMDGYTLTAEIRSNPKLAKLYVVLHTSLSGVFNQAMVQKVGADHFIAKFQPDILAKTVQDQLKRRLGIPVDA